MLLKVNKYDGVFHFHLIREPVTILTRALYKRPGTNFILSRVKKTIEAGFLTLSFLNFIHDKTC